MFQAMEENCPPPCYQKGYSCKMEYLHKNLYMNVDDNNIEVINSTFFLFVGWESILIEEVVEALVYDEVNFIAAAGGNLGLLLGFSCFTMIKQLIDFIKGV